MEKKVRAHVIIGGRVQGVFFRDATCRVAEKYGVSGWVKNRGDGTVEAVFEGSEEGVHSVIKWCNQGTPHAKVDRVDVNWEDYRGEFEGFEITY